MIGTSECARGLEDGCPALSNSKGKSLRCDLGQSVMSGSQPHREIAIASPNYNGRENRRTVLVQGATGWFQRSAGNSRPLSSVHNPQLDVIVSRVAPTAEERRLAGLQKSNPRKGLNENVVKSNKNGSMSNAVSAIPQKLYLSRCIQLFAATWLQEQWRHSHAWIL